MDASASIYLAGKQMSSIYKTTCRHFNEMLDFGFMTSFFPLRLEDTTRAHGFRSRFCCGKTDLFIKFKIFFVLIFYFSVFKYILM